MTVLQTITEEVMIGKLDQAMRFNETALALREQRQQVLASNIANADTPNYKARDIDFGRALEGAMGRASTTPALRVTASNHITVGSRSTEGVSAPLMYRTPNQASIDGNTVEMDNERNQFAGNAIRYEASLTFLSAQIKSLLAAIQG
ncbi:MAG: flagellar basal body rod protein FlgB [Burkholderiaceae bacterium]